MMPKTETSGDDTAEE